MINILFRVQFVQWTDDASVIENYRRLEHKWYTVAKDAIQTRFRIFELEYRTCHIIAPSIHHRRSLCYFLLPLSGNVYVNPGPFPCTVCRKPVRSDQTA